MRKERGKKYNRKCRMKLAIDFADISRILFAIVLCIFKRLHHSTDGYDKMRQKKTWTWRRRKRTTEKVFFFVRANICLFRLLAISTFRAHFSIRFSPSIVAIIHFFVYSSFFTFTRHKIFLIYFWFCWSFFFTFCFISSSTSISFRFIIYTFSLSLICKGTNKRQSIFVFVFLLQLTIEKNELFSTPKISTWR